jgi:hypothetical protein
MALTCRRWFRRVADGTDTLADDSQALRIALDASGSLWPVATMPSASRMILSRRG